MKAAQPWSQEQLSPLGTLVVSGILLSAVCVCALFVPFAVVGQITRDAVSKRITSHKDVQEILEELAHEAAPPQGN